jgi:glycosyltransferase involved in cell wall biosynthesis
MNTNSGFFHLVDHSYSHLLHYLPKDRTGVYCHDLDAFRCLLEPTKERRPFWFVRMTKYVFEGFLKARVVFCNSEITRTSILRLNHWKSDDVHLIPLGICDEFVADGPGEPGEYLLHVGSCIPRKRIDVLLNVFAMVCQSHPSLRLIQAGGTFTKSQEEYIDNLGIRDSVEQRRGLSREDLAKLYRGAKCLLITSDSEGFGLPSIEAIKCGCPVISNKLPSIEEAVGNFARYACNNDLIKWVSEVEALLSCPLKKTSIEFKNLNKFSWQSYTNSIMKVYEDLSKNTY